MESVTGSGVLPQGEGDITLQKRLFDIVVAAAILLIALPILGLISVMIRIDSSGPVLFLQLRRGVGGKPFWLYKFRSMYAELEDKLSSQQSKRYDSRVTRFGRFLRRYSLDELPQLFNVLRGDMSLVGPRPHALGTNIAGVALPDISDAYLLRYVVRPGITGWAQVNGHRGILNEPADLLKRLENDFYYIRNRSLRLDLRISLLTVLAFLRDNNAF
jgi:lipopolysaccharide/colanic/teichoic acid biosynthesis glycosyltransferase